MTVSQSSTRSSSQPTTQQRADCAQKIHELLVRLRPFRVFVSRLARASGSLHRGEAQFVLDLFEYYRERGEPTQCSLTDVYTVRVCEAQVTRLLIRRLESQVAAATDDDVTSKRRAALQLREAWRSTLFQRVLALVAHMPAATSADRLTFVRITRLTSAPSSHQLLASMPDAEVESVYDTLQRAVLRVHQLLRLKSSVLDGVLSRSTRMFGSAARLTPGQHAEPAGPPAGGVPGGGGGGAGSAVAGGDGVALFASSQ